MTYTLLVLIVMMQLACFLMSTLRVIISIQNNVRIKAMHDEARKEDDAEINNAL